MPLPASFARDGFSPEANASKSRRKVRLRNGKYLKPLLIGTEGETDTGKTEFLLSCPNPGIIICLDRAFDPVLDNPNPPSARNVEGFYFSVVSVPLATTTKDKAEYADYFNQVKSKYYKALDNPDALTVVIDGDSDFWELHRLANFGKLTKVWPQTEYTDVYAQRRAMTARAYDSGKIVIGTNKVRDEYVTVTDSNGKPIMGDDGKEKRTKSGNKQRQGFPDQQYLWQIQLRHLFKPAGINPYTKKPTPNQWGLRILKCKANMEFVGTELWGEDCNFAGLVQVVYPNVDLEEWGF